MLSYGLAKFHLQQFVPELKVVMEVFIAVSNMPVKNVSPNTFQLLVPH